MGFFMFIDNSTISEGKIQHGLCWIYMGMIQSTILRPVGNVDPVKERNVKVDNLTHEVNLSIPDYNACQNKFIDNV